jgi:N-acetylglucosaminyldiphosphoundecaprenol N-acetyl-beta-D-mannosaminyltransferase
MIKEEPPRRVEGALPSHGVGASRGGGKCCERIQLVAGAGAPQRVEVLGVPVDVVDMQGALAFADRTIQSGKSGSPILAVNPEKVIALHRDPALTAFFRTAGLLIPDGIGVVWAARLLHGVRAARVPGADLMQELCALAARSGYPIYLLGSKEEVSACVARKLQARYPGLRIAGRTNGFVPLERMRGVVDEINRSGAKILFVALGSPKQERWIAEHGPRLRVNVIQGIGGTLDTIAGTVQRAPAAWQRVNLEWLFRLLRNPRRAGRQMGLAVFAWKVLLAKLAGAGERTSPADAASGENAGLPLDRGILESSVERGVGRGLGGRVSSSF